MAYVTLNQDGEVTGTFAQPQQGLVGFAIIDDNDERLADFQRKADLPSLAFAALHESDRTILRCMENNVTVPTEWAEYRAALRAIRTGQSLEELPERPPFPSGT